MEKVVHIWYILNVFPILGLFQPFTVSTYKSDSEFFWNVKKDLPHQFRTFLDLLKSGQEHLDISFLSQAFPLNKYIFEVNKRNFTWKYEICSQLTIETSERRQWPHPDVFIVNFEHISHLFLNFLLLTLNK